MATQTPPFFGRTRELAKLTERAAAPGITIVRGRPQIGKTRLLTEFAEKLRSQGRIVGIGNASEAAGDTLRRAVADAYDHWLRDASAVEQLKQVAEQQKGGLTGRVGKVFGRILKQAGEDAAKFVPGTGTVLAIFEEAFSALATTNEDLRAGGQRPGPIESDEVKQFLRPLTNADDPPVVLILNQWEEGQNISLDAATLREFARVMDEWPPLHVVIHLRDPRHAGDPNADPPGDAGTLASNLVKSGRAEYLDLTPIDFASDVDLQACDQLMEYLRRHVPGAIKIGDTSTILSIIDGNPGVLERWHKASNAQRDNPDTLRTLAEHAHNYHYPEVESALCSLLPNPGDSPETRQTLMVALRLALLPGTLPAPAWSACERAILDGAPRSILSDLCSQRLIERSADGVCGYGHPTRHAVAHRWALDIGKRDGASKPTAIAHSREATERFVFMLIEDEKFQLEADQDVVTTFRVHVIVSLYTPSQMANTCAATRAAIAAAQTLFDLPYNEADLMSISSKIGSNQSNLRLLIAMGLVNAIADNKSNLSCTEDLLNDLRIIDRKNSDNLSIQNRFAMGLVNTIAAINEDYPRADDLLMELCNLAKAYPDNNSIRHSLARAHAALFIGSLSTQDICRMIEHAESLAQLRDAMPADAEFIHIIKRAFVDAFDFTLRQNDHVAGKRLTTAFRTVFGL